MRPARLALLALALLVGCSRPEAVQRVECKDPLAGCRLDEEIVVRFSSVPATMQKFDLLVEAPADAKPMASFQMRDMEMGLNRYRLLRQDNGWHAEVMLPACVRGRQDWILRLEVDGRVYEMPFTSG